MAFQFIDINVSHFRGFGDLSQPVNLKGNIALFYGPNGFGKTSLSEAIEWLLYGCTKRRKRGDKLSKQEYKDTYSNVHGGSPVEVTATIFFDDGSEHTISRQMHGDGEESFTLIDGTPADFEDIGITPLECFYPVVAQHELQSFILTSPKSRRDEISTALGLGELTSLKTALQGAHQSLSSNPPDNLQLAKRTLLATLSPLDELECAESLCRKWRQDQFDFDDDWKDIVAIAEQLTNLRIETKQELLQTIGIKIQEVRNSLFDSTKICFGTGADKNLPAFEETSGTVESHFTELHRIMALVIAANAKALNIALLELWESGLKLAGDSQECPMCEEHTLTDEKKAALRKRISENTEVKENQSALQTTITNIRMTLTTLNTDGKQYTLKELSEDEQQFLSNLLPDEPGLYQQFLQAYNHHLTTTTKFTEAIEAAQKFITDLPVNLPDPEKGEACLEECKTISEALNSALQELLHSIKVYQPILTKFWEKAATSIASNEVIQILEALKKIIENDENIKLVTRYNTELKALKKLMQDAEKHIKTLQNTLLSDRGDEVKQWYDALNPDSEVGFETMQPGTGKLELHASSYGTRMPAAANLSECQLNCLGLAVWIMRATSEQSPFGFIVFDDPVQSMDDDHTENFIATVIPSLIENCGKQVIVLSHTKRLIDRLKEFNSTRLTKHYHFDNYDRHGPQITQQVKLQQDLSNIKSLMSGNEHDREIAVEKIRELAENVIRKCYYAEHQQSLPAKYDRAEPKALLDAFSKLSNTSATESSGLKDTFTFSSPAHHTDPNYTTPVKANIQPHYSRLEKMIRDYKLS